MITITGSVGSSGKYLVTGMPVTTKPDADFMLRMAFENKTGGTNLALGAGSTADFAAGTFQVRLSDSGGPGFQFLTLVDTAQLRGMVIYVIREVGTAVSQFTLSIE